VHNRKPNKMANNGLKYQRIDTELREKLRAQWNEPVLWPFGMALLVLVLSAIPAVVVYRRRERASAVMPAQSGA